MAVLSIITTKQEEGMQMIQQQKNRFGLKLLLMQIRRAWWLSALLLLATVIVTLGLQTEGMAAINLLRSFAGGSGDGAYPYYSHVIQDGSTLYGMTGSGGSSNYGVIFKIKTDGSSFTLLHTFAGGSGDGANSIGSLTLSGSTLYGMANWGGSSDKGVIFRINTDGNSFTLLHSFAGGSGDGAYPYGSLAGTSFYGMTCSGGASDKGTIFSLTSATRIDLVSFQAKARFGQTDAANGPKVILTWDTASEVDNAGFHLCRAQQENGEYSRITPHLVPARGDSMTGASYMYEDHDVTVGQTYYYQLEDIDNAGYSIFHGPVSVFVGDAASAFLQGATDSSESGDSIARTTKSDSGHGGCFIDCLMKGLMCD